MKKLILIASLVSASSTVFAEEAKSFSVTAGLDYSTGKYGTASTTDIWYFPVAFKSEAGKLTLKLTVPYIRITGAGNVVRDVGAIRTTVVTARTTESGLGDIVAAAGYNVYDSGVNGILLDITGKIKVATADETRGLGTGKNDYSIQADAYKRSDKTTFFGTFGYKVMGKPAGVPMNNVFYWSLGASEKLNSETSAGVMLDMRERAVSTGHDQLEATFYVAQKISREWKCQAYLVKGFSDGSPDWGGGATFSYSY